MEIVSSIPGDKYTKQSVIVVTGTWLTKNEQYEVKTKRDIFIDYKWTRKQN